MGRARGEELFETVREGAERSGRSRLGDEVAIPVCARLRDEPHDEVCLAAADDGLGELRRAVLSHRGRVDDVVKDQHGGIEGSGA